MTLHHHLLPASPAKKPIVRFFNRTPFVPRPDTWIWHSGLVWWGGNGYRLYGVTSGSTLNLVSDP